MKRFCVYRRDTVYLGDGSGLQKYTVAKRDPVGAKAVQYTELLSGFTLKQANRISDVLETEWRNR